MTAYKYFSGEWICVTNNVFFSVLYQCLYSYCGVKDPSWAEIRHFVKFLDLQLQSCESSIFCNEDLVGDVMAGLKSFVVKFMIRMSRVWSLLFCIILSPNPLCVCL